LSRYNEDMSWVKNLGQDVRKNGDIPQILIYNKGGREDVSDGNI